MTDRLNQQVRTLLDSFARWVVEAAFGAADGGAGAATAAAGRWEGRVAAPLALAHAALAVGVAALEACCAPGTFPFCASTCGHVSPPHADI